MVPSIVDNQTVLLTLKWDPTKHDESGFEWSWE